MAKATTKAMEGITRPIELKLNVQPIFGSLIHEVAYEGPCRFGDKDELTKEFDTRASAMGFKAFKEKLEAKFGADQDVNLLEPMCMACSDEFHFDESLFRAIDAVIGDVDAFFLYGNPMPRLVREIAARYGKTMLILTNSGAITISEMSDLINRGYTKAYGCIDWNEVVAKMHALKALKALAHTRVLKMIRHEGDLYLTDDFKTDANFGVLATSINMHEMMDQLHDGGGTGNYTLPLRTVYNLTDEEDAEAERITDELIAEADECWMERDKVLKSVRFNVLTRKLMEHFQCNAFTAQCKECCATTRINEEQVTYCLGHSLNIECGIMSACEGDMNALQAMTVLASLSRKAPYMSNTNPLVLENGEIVAKNWFSDQPCVHEYPDQLYCTWHATPNRYMQGYDEEPSSYAVGPFTANARFGATIRYKFAEDAGKTVTLMRFNPAGTKMLVIKGEVVGGTGYDRFGCPEGVYFKVSDRDGLFHTQLEFGNHIPLVYGDYVEELKQFGEVAGLEVVVRE